MTAQGPARQSDYREPSSAVGALCRHPARRRVSALCIGQVVGTGRSQFVYRGRCSCVQNYRRTAIAPVFPLAKRQAKNLSLSKRKVTTTIGSRTRHGNCSAAIRALPFTFSLGFQRAAAIDTPRASVRPIPSSGSFFGHGKAGNGYAPAWKAAPILGGLNCRHTSGWARRRTRQGEA